MKQIIILKNISKKKGIVHIVSRSHHPQTNGKLEKWFDLYEA
jgi:transposase InsO family protein